MMKGRPQIKCPKCGSRLLNAGNKTVYNDTIIKILESENEHHDFIIRCNKCKTFIGIDNNYSTPLINSTSRDSSSHLRTCAS